MTMQTQEQVSPGHAVPRIDVWCAFFGEIGLESLHEAYRGVLSEAERLQEQRFHFAVDRRRFLVTRALVRTVLSKYADIEARDWTFTTNAYGRPAISNPDVIAGRISFNVSHTKSLIVLAVTHGLALGIDTENAIDREAPLELVSRFFAVPEVNAMTELPLAARQQRFYEYWTLKESYIKARGMGLSIPLEKFHFSFQGSDQVSLSVDPVLNDPARWWIWQFEVLDTYALALCCERIAAAVPEVRFRKIVPMRFDEPLACRLVRSSASMPPP